MGRLQGALLRVILDGQHVRQLNDGYADVRACVRMMRQLVCDPPEMSVRMLHELLLKGIIDASHMVGSRWCWIVSGSSRTAPSWCYIRTKYEILFVFGSGALDWNCISFLAGNLSLVLFKMHGYTGGVYASPNCRARALFMHRIKLDDVYFVAVVFIVSNASEQNINQFRSRTYR